jgi:small-conductance mechanosensitive channel
MTELIDSLAETHHHPDDGGQRASSARGAENGPWRIILFAVVAALAAAAYGLVVAIPTALLPNPFFRRMTPPTLWSWTFLITPALVFGPLVATFLAPLRARRCSVERQTLGAGLLSYLAVGCPVCNKIVVAVLGVTGALTYFEPVQPVLGALSVALLGYALWLRLTPSR